MSTVFINYRTGDEDGSAVLIERELSRRFGSERVFRAGKSIPPGAAWPQEILAAVRGSRALVAVIGPRWLATDQRGRRALDRESDWTRREIVAAFTYAVPVIPVLIGTTPVLTTDDLPPTLAPLAACQYLRLDHHDLDAGLDRLTSALATWMPPRRARRSWLVRRTTSAPRRAARPP
jgi:hypothetical protein